MATHGSIGEFNAAIEDWISYTERLEQYFTANGVATAQADKRRAILLSGCGPTTYQLIRSLVSPAKTTDKTYAELVKLVREHQQPTPSFIVQRFNFHMCLQKSNESISDFVAQLRKLSEHCRFGEQLEDMLRDRMVCGCRDKQLQCRLLSEPDLSYDKAFKMARARETAEQEAKNLHPNDENPVHSLRSKGPPQRKHSTKHENCYRCGGKHQADSCKFKTASCNYCHKQGHIANVCFKKACDSKKQPAKLTHQLHVDEEPLGPEYAVHYAATPRTDPILVTVNLNSVDHAMEVDTGATLSVISNQTYNTLWPKNKAPPLRPCSTRLKTYTGQPISVKGSIEVDVCYEDKSHSLDLLIVQGSGPSLLGRDWLRAIRLDWSYLKLVRSSPDLKCQQVIDRYPSVFKDELGHISGSSAHFEVDPDAQPKFCRARRVPYALCSKVEAELDRLEKSKIISHVTFSKWAAPIVPVLKRDGTIRICGDYKLTVNQATKTDPYPLPRIDDLFASLSKGKSFTKLDLLKHTYKYPYLMKPES